MAIDGSGPTVARCVSEINHFAKSTPAAAAPPSSAFPGTPEVMAVARYFASEEKRPCVLCNPLTGCSR